jgi:hypothetical protein
MEKKESETTPILLLRRHQSNSSPSLGHFSSNLNSNNKNQNQTFGSLNFFEAKSRGISQIQERKNKLLTNNSPMLPLHVAVVIFRMTKPI